MTAATVSAKHPAARVEIPATKLFDRQAWLRARQTGVTSTDSRVLSGHGYDGETVTGVWLGKVEPVDPEADEDTPLAWELGQDFEPLIAKHAARHHGTTFARCGMLRSTRAAHLLASPDASCSCGGHGEWKSTASWALERHDDGHTRGWTLPPAWRVQTQHTLMVSGRDHVHVSALIVDRRDFAHWTVEADPDEHARLRAFADRFWDLVERRELPPLDWGRVTAAEIAKRWPTADDDAEILRDPTEVWRLIRDRAALKAGIKEDEDALAAIEGRLKVIAGPHQAVKDDTGNVLFRYGNRGRTSVDYAALLADHPEIEIGKYQKVTQFRAFSGFAKGA